MSALFGFGIAGVLGYGIYKYFIISGRDGTKAVRSSDKRNIGTPPAIASQIRVGDVMTVDVKTYGKPMGSVSSGNAILTVTELPNLETMTVRGVSNDPRIPVGSRFDVPLSAVSGLGDA